MIWPFGSRQSVIGPLVASQAADVAVLHAASFARPWSVLEVEQLIRDPSVIGHAATDGRNSAVIGFILTRVAADEAEIISVAVGKSERGRGIARQLVAANLAEAASRNVGSVFLEVDEQNTAARALYDRLGFQPVGMRTAYYRKPDGTAATAIVMRLDMD